MDNYIQIYAIDYPTRKSKYNSLEELDNYGLEDWQKELVKKGEYDPWNFEEDDYYYEDDK